jgi:transcriptional regulator with XRE-family HTH domain
MSSSAQKQTILRSMGDRIRDIRKSKDISQEELAFKAKIDRSYMGRIERGEKNITVLTLHQIAKTLGVSASKIVSE